MEFEDDEDEPVMLKKMAREEGKGYDFGRVR